MCGKICHWTLAILVGLSASGSAIALDDPNSGIRTWRDRSGKHSIEAELISCDNSLVQLKKTDGTTISISLKQLSNADKWYIRKEMKSRKALNSTTKNSTAKTLSPQRTIETQPEKVQPKNVQAAKDRKLDLRQVKRQVVTKRLFGVDWHQSPESFQAASKLAASKLNESAKPVMWFRVLGDLEGFM